jgi:hypothetical protein
MVQVQRATTRPYIYATAPFGDRPLLPHCAYCRTADNPEPPARGASELRTRSASALLEQYEARLGQHPLLPRGQAAAGLASRQVADYLNDLDQIP